MNFDLAMKWKTRNLYETQKWVSRARSMSETAQKSWRTRRARKAVETRKKNVLHAKLSKVAIREVTKRKEVQDLVAKYLKEWWKKEYLKGTPSKTQPLKCEICGESLRLGLAIHHIDPSIKKSDERYNIFENKAPLCGTCHNIITYKKTRKPEEIVKAITSRHDNALKMRLLRHV